MAGGALMNSTDCGANVLTVRVSVVMRFWNRLLVALRNRTVIVADPDAGTLA